MLFLQNKKINVARIYYLCNVQRQRTYTIHSESGYIFIPFLETISVRYRLSVSAGYSHFDVSICSLARMET